MEPIAIVGIGCRFPQANSPQDFWQLLQNGRQAITSIPADRWPVAAFYDPAPQAAGKMNSCQGGFLSDVNCFDAAFFGISDAEAGHIDPQQRLFLETAWAALEYANILPLSLGGSATGVFTGLCTVDYHRLLYRNFDCIGPHSGTGTTMSITANRLSYLLDLRGPSMAVDAACSSALVAVHLACQSLRSLESDLCIAGGVNLILSPDSMISSAQTGLLSVGGACRPFDAKADGYVRGEGCGVVVLKRLSDATADNDNILALIRGSAVNQDGLSNSLTAPNGLAQQALIERSLTNSEVAAKDIDYVEAHAVGTQLGDAIEFKALKKVLMKDRDRPCWVGSVKPNIGHLEAASGMAALIKVVLSLCHEEIPPQLNFEQANAYVDLENSLFEIALEGRSWPRSQKARLAGVSTFGFGGTNAHIVVAEAPDQAVSHRDSTVKEDFSDRSHHILTLSAKTPSALRRLVDRYIAFLDEATNEISLDKSTGGLELADLCFSANTGRSHFPERLCLVAGSLETLQQQLAQFTQGEEPLLAHSFISRRVKGRKRPRVAFSFPAPTHGTLWLGQQLYQTQPAFRQTFERCAALATIPLSLDSLIDPTAADSSLVESVASKVAGFVIAYSLASMWQQWGVEPDKVVGEGIGEYAAACVAGLLEVEEILPMLSEPLFDRFSNPSSGQSSGSLLPPTDLSGCNLVLPMGADRALPRGQKSFDAHTQVMALYSELEIWPQLLLQLGQLFVKGMPVNWAAFDRGYERSHLLLPTYPFERSPYWFMPASPPANDHHASSSLSPVKASWKIKR